jgi:hypothetical protein
MDMRGIWTNSSTIITAFEGAYEFLHQPTVSHDINMMTHVPKLQLADPREQEELPIEILVGDNHYWKIVKDSPPWRISTPVALLPSRLGWVLSSNRTGISVKVAAVNLLHIQGLGPLPETEIKRFWDLDNIGIKARQEESWNTKDSAVLQAFHDSFRIEDIRRVVSLPKKENVTLPNNRQNAEKRFASLEVRLRKKCEPASHLLHSHAGLHTRWTSGSSRCGRRVVGHILLASSSGVQR